MKTGKLGRLSKDKMGFSMPAVAPLYQPPPYYFTNAESITIAWETDEEAALELLPEGIELVQPATASIRVNYYPFSTLGTYYEVVLGIACRFEGELRGYTAFIVLDQDVPFAVGREVWGVAKKMAYIEFTREMGLYTGIVERPKGNRLCTVMIQPETPADTENLAWPKAALHLKLIPSPEKGKPPSIAELVELPIPVKVHELWSGKGSVSFDTKSEIDPWHLLEVKKVISATYARLDMVLDWGRIVKRY